MIQQGTEAWFSARRGKITASIAASCLGLNPYTSGAEAWRQIKGISPKQQPNEHMRRGLAWEETTRRRYQACLLALGVPLGDVVLSPGMQIVQLGGFWVHPQHPWLAASPDGLIGQDGLVELKNPCKVPASVPIQYRIQCLVQLACTGRQWCDFFSWPPCSPTHYWERIVRPPETALAALIRRLERWYRLYVVGNVQPPRKNASKQAKVAEEALAWGFDA